MKRSIKRASRFLYDSLYALPIGCAPALVWVNTLPESYYRTAHALAFVVNDIGLHCRWPGPLVARWSPSRSS